MGWIQAEGLGGVVPVFARHFRLFFAYIQSMKGLLRSELSYRNLSRSAHWPAETTYGQTPSVIYLENAAGEHGNFLPTTYRRILKNPDWKKRLTKAYTGSRFVPRSNDRRRGELECANSSDALLMNIFCYPGVLRRPAVRSLFSIESSSEITFGFRPAIPLSNGRNDRTEVDLKLGNLLLEAKLTEGDFQTARCDLVNRYRDLEAVFEIERLLRRGERYRSYQLIRGALAAQAHATNFCVLCDQRRPDLLENCFEVFSAVRDSGLRCRLSVITWQELSASLPKTLRTFLNHKYGIA
jgi:hypothetical protein